MTNETPLAAQQSPRPLDWPPILEALQSLLRNQPDVYLVGGAVRDAFLHRPIHDLDFATQGDGRKIAKLVADKFEGAYYPLDADRGVGRAIISYGGERFVVDAAQFRGETLAEDLSGRDFTINALAVPLDGDMQSVIDPTGGIPDLLQKRMRRCTPTSLQDDPVRVLRAVRQSVALNFMIEPETRADLRRYGPNLSNVSIERIRDEFMTMLGGSRPHVALRTLDALGLLKLIVPEVETMRGVQQSAPHIFDVWEHTLNVVERLYGVLLTISPQRTDETAADSAFGMIVYLQDRYRKQLQAHLDIPLPNGRSVQSLLILAALLHDAGKPFTKSVDEDGRIHFYKHEVNGAEIAEARGIALRLSNEEVTRLSEIIRHHMRPMVLVMNTAFNERENKPELSRRSVYRYWKHAGDVGLDVCVLTMADYLGMVGVNFNLQDWIKRLLIIGELYEGYFNQKEQVVAPPPLVTGNDLITQLALKPGPKIGQILSAISEAQAAGEISTVDEALALAREVLNMPDNAADE